MNDTLQQLIADFEFKKILVLGDTILNWNLQGKENNLSLEVSVPVVKVKETNYALGGAANRAENVVNLGRKVVFLSVIGNDSEGKFLQDILQKQGISIQYLLTDSARKTWTKQRIFNGDNLLVKCDWGTTDNLARETENELIASLECLYGICDAIVVSDYSGGIVTPAVIASLKKLQVNTPKTIVVDSQRLELYCQLKITAVKQDEQKATSSLSPLSYAYAPQEKLVNDRKILTQVVQQHRQIGQKMVFTNGCFDILHPGHVTYLAQAKALGDILVVGVNSDESIKQLKGFQRPINSLRDRLQVLAALASIDYVVPFQESTPSELLKIVCPDIYVKGGDYTRETLPETPVVEELGGVIKILPFVGSNSTTKIIEKIRNLTSD